MLDKNRSMLYTNHHSEISWKPERWWVVRFMFWHILPRNYITNFQKKFQSKHRPNLEMMCDHYHFYVSGLCFVDRLERVQNLSKGWMMFLHWTAGKHLIMMRNCKVINWWLILDFIIQISTAVSLSMLVLNTMNVCYYVHGADFYFFMCV